MSFYKKSLILLSALGLVALVSACADPLAGTPSPSPAASPSPTPTPSPSPSPGKSPVVYGTISYSVSPTSAVIAAGSSGNFTITDSSTAGQVSLQMPATLSNPIVSLSVSLVSNGYGVWTFNESTKIMTIRNYTIAAAAGSSPVLTSVPFSIVIY